MYVMSFRFESDLKVKCLDLNKTQNKKCLICEIFSSYAPFHFCPCQRLYSKRVIWLKTPQYEA